MAKDQILCPDPDCTSRFTTARGLVAHMTKQHNHDELSGSSDSASELEVPIATGARAVTTPPAKRPVYLGGKVNGLRSKGMGRKRPVKGLMKDTGGHKRASRQGRRAPFSIPYRQQRTPTPPPRRRKAFRSIAMGHMGESAGSSSAVYIDLRTPSLISNTESSSSSEEDESGSDAFGLCGGSAVPAKQVDTPKTPIPGMSSASQDTIKSPAGTTVRLDATCAHGTDSAASTPTTKQPIATPPASSNPLLKKKPSWAVRTPSPITLVDRRPAANSISQSRSPQSAESDADEDESLSGSGSDAGSSSEVDEVSAELDHHPAGTVITYSNKVNTSAFPQAANKSTIITLTTPARSMIRSAKTAVSSSEDEGPVTPSKPPVRDVPRKSPPVPLLNRSIPRTPNALEAFRLGAMEEPAGSFLTPLRGPNQHKAPGSLNSTTKEHTLSVNLKTAYKQPQSASAPIKASSIRPAPQPVSIAGAARPIGTPATDMTRTPMSAAQAYQHADRPMVPDLPAGNTHKVLGAIARFLLDLSEIGSETNRSITPIASSGMYTPVSEAGVNAPKSRNGKRARVAGEEEDEDRSERVKRLTEDLRGVTGL